MKPTEREDYAKYRMEKSRETLEVASLLIQNSKWNSAVNRLYYAAYYAISGLLVKSGIESKTHTGVKTQFLLHYVKTGKVDMSFGKLYADLFDWRQKRRLRRFFRFHRRRCRTAFYPNKGTDRRNFRTNYEAKITTPQPNYTMPNLTTIINTIIVVNPPG
jgi:uncharacterized protein